MKENKYDDAEFFAAYAKMPRSVEGLAGAGEWPEFKKLIPALEGKEVLDLGCGYGWHCRYAIEVGARRVVGVDISEKMIARAREGTTDSRVEYCQCPVEDYEAPARSFDLVVSSLTFHYLVSFAAIAEKAFRLLRDGGRFVFSVEHPIFTASGEQDWAYNASGERIHWPVDRYFEPGSRTTRFLGYPVVKYHRTIATYLSDLMDCGFSLERFVEPTPSDADLAAHPEWRDERRRPLFLIMAARKSEE